MDYVSNTPEEREKMMTAIGVKNIEELFSIIPRTVSFDRPLNIRGGMTEAELIDEIENIADKNTSLKEMTSFMGAGSYDHYIPSIIDHLISRSEFYTAYTPYQAELSQGTLQSIYEYQSMICELTEMEIANASLLDGGSAAAEAVLMAARITGKNSVMLAGGINPVYREVIRTYGYPQQLNFVETAVKNAVTDIKNIEGKMDSDTAALVIQYPNFYGSIEQISKIEELTEKYQDTLLIVISNPVSLGLLKPPGAFGADIVVGEGQVLGNNINYGGPYLGFMAIRNNRKHLRQMPGRIAGATTDVDGNKGFVLTIQTREQHIRRGRATSNICTNEALNALQAAIYMAAMGKKGMAEVASQSLKKAHYLAAGIEKIAGFSVVNNDNFFHEFWVQTPIPAADIIKKMESRNILGGIELSRFGENDGLLVCVTEKRTKVEMDKYLSVLEEIADERTTDY